MQKKCFILLEEFSKKPTAQIGQVSKSISKLFTLGVSVPKAICIPPKTLRLIAKANNLDIKIHKLIQETDFTSSLSKNKTASKIKQLISKQRIPQELSTEFLKLYHEYLQSSFVLTKNSNSLEDEDDSLQNIKGDTNVVDAFLEVWTVSVQQAFKKLIFKTQSSDKILFSNPMLIQQQIDCDVSGTAFTFDKSDGNKKRFTIQATLGIVKNNSNKTSTYTVDCRTFVLINKNEKLQTTEYIRNLEYLKKQKLSVSKQGKSTLTNSQTSKLAKIISKINRTSIIPLEINWGLQNNTYFITKVKKTHYTSNSSSKNSKTIKKLYVSVTKKQDTNIIKNHADGVCILNSGQLISVLDEHPMMLTKATKLSQKKLLIEAVSKTINSYTLVNKEATHIIYRSQNSTSKELLKLKHSGNYEEKEDNPYLGLRGASRILGQPQIFKIELKIIENLLSKGNKVSLLIPFARSADEVSQVIKLVEKNKFLSNKTANFDIWLELSTPENVLNLKEYPLKKIAGVVFNTRSIYGLALGIGSINKNTLAKYSSYNFILDLIENVSKTLTKKHKLFVDLASFGLSIVKDVVNKDIDGIIVNPKVTAVAKKCIINEEKKLILYGKN